jgi:hypothetical protein
LAGALHGVDRAGVIVVGAVLFDVLEKHVVHENYCMACGFIGRALNCVFCVLTQRRTAFRLCRE